MDTDLVLGRVGSSSAIGNTEGANAIRIHCLAAAVHQWVVGVGVRVDSVCGRVGTGISAGVAVAVRVRHARGERRGHFTVGAGRGVAPSSVSALVLGHGQTTDGGQGWVVVGVEAILLHLFPALVFCALALLALSPEKDAAQHQQRHDHNGDDDGNGSLAAAAHAAAVFLLRILQASGARAGRVGACGGRGCPFCGRCNITRWGDD